jgi:superfamily II DNA/RNA helicase
MSFKELGLSDPILRSLEDLKHSGPSEIQKQAIPIVLSGKNIMLLPRLVPVKPAVLFYQ